MLDAGFIAYDLYDIGKSIINGKQVTSTQIGALLTDVACAATPFATGGGIAFRAASKADDAAKAAKVADKASDAKKATEGIYEFTAKSGNTYVGESGNVEKRINQHIKSGKVTPENASKAIIKEVSGGKNVRRVAEQKRINQLGGIEKLHNKINSIAEKYWKNLNIQPPKKINNGN